MRELYNSVGVVQSLAPAVISATATQTEIDLAGFESALVLINAGAIVSAGDFTVSLEHSDTTTNEDFAACTSGHLVGSFPASLAAASAYKVGYKGGKRYIRTVITKNSGTSVAAGIQVLKGHPLTGPVA